MDKGPRRSLVKVRPFRLLHQLLAITDIDFINRRIVAYTELQLRILQSDVREICLNCKQSQIFRVTLNEDIELDYSLVDPLLDVCQAETKKRNLDFVSKKHSEAVKAVDADRGCGELRIILPDKYPLNSSPTGRNFGPDVVTIGIEFILENPVAGLYFVVPPFRPEKSIAERGSYVITGGADCSPRLWFPCVDSCAEICTWVIEVTTDREFTVISCGDLISNALTSDGRQRTFIFSQGVPVSATHIGLAVGPFETLTDPNRNEIVHYCLPNLMSLLKQSTSYLHEAFEFCEEYLSIRYPFNIYRQVFVDQTFMDITSYATLSIINCSYLFPKSILEQNVSSRSLMTIGAYRQFFGVYLAPKSWDDYWISFGITEYLHGLYFRKYFGINEYRYQVYEQTKAVTKFEHEKHPIVLVSPKDPSYVNEHFHFQALFPQTCSEEYNRLRWIKAHLVVRMLDDRIGPQILAQVFNKMLTQAATAAVAKEYDAWNGLLITTDDFIQEINANTSKDIKPFFDKWVFTGGHARFKGKFNFNRKRNTIEMEFTQEIGAKGCAPYSGPFPLAAQELDGCPKHTIQIEEKQSKYDVTCHSKTRRHKKKRIPIWTGEEVDVDLNEADPDCPVLWMKFDTDLTLIRSITFEQPDYQLLFLVRHDRDIVAQLAGLEALETSQSLLTKSAFNVIVENEKAFYRLRLAAAEALTRISNRLVLSSATWTSPPPLFAYFKKHYFVRLPSTAAGGAPIASNIVKQNDFHDFIRYFLQKKLPVCMAQIRNPNNVCPPEIVTLLLDLWKYNENRRNFYSDSYYRAALIEAFGYTFTESVGTLSVSDDPKIQFDQLNQPTRLCLENIFRAMNQEKYLPSYHYVVTIACLGAFRKLHRQGVLPVDWCLKVYRDYTNPLLYRDVRIAAFGHLIDHMKVQVSAKLAPCHDILDFVLTSAQTDHDPFMQHSILRLLIENPPFTRETSRPDECPLSTVALVDRLFTWINTGSTHDSRVRCDLIDLYHVLFGRKRPGPVPLPELGMLLNLKAGKAVLSDASKASMDAKVVPTATTPPDEVRMFPSSSEGTASSYVPTASSSLDASESQGYDRRPGSMAENNTVENQYTSSKSSKKRAHKDEDDSDPERGHKKKKKHKHKDKHKHKKHKRGSDRHNFDSRGEESPS